MKHDAGQALSGERHITIEGSIDPGVSAVVRIVLHQKLFSRRIDDRMTELRAPDARIFHCAVYSDDVLENGREPFQQLSPCAYLPVMYADLDQQALPRFGAVLIERRPHRGEYLSFIYDADSIRFAHADLDPSAARAALAEICERAGLRREDANVTISAMTTQFPALKAVA